MPETPPSDPTPPGSTPPEPTLSGIPRRLGDFELLAEVGRGGMGIVFKARQISLDRQVALKVLKADVLGDSAQVERFRREAIAVGKLDHAGIVRVFSAGEDRGLSYFAMEWIDGHDLSVELRRLREGKRGPSAAAGDLPAPTTSGYFQAVALLVRAIADALAHAHAHGIVHRDIKPSNILVDRQGEVRLVDFGLARDRELGAITRATEIAGTPHYMSPEQARALVHQVDERTDVYSLGVVLYELLTLRQPFQGRTAAEIIDRIVYSEPPSLKRLNPRVPRDLDTICQQAMQKAPGDRYPSAAAFREDLERFLSHEAILATGPSMRSRIVRFARRRRFWLAGAACVLVASGAAWMTSRHLERRRTLGELKDSLALTRTVSQLDALALPVLLDARRDARALAERRDELDPDEVAWVDRLDAQFTDLRRTWAEQVESALARSGEAQVDDGTRERARLEALKLLQRGAALFPDDERFSGRSGIDAVFPRLTIRALGIDGQPTPATVRLYAVDVATSAVGEARELGPTPIVDERLQSGVYRATVIFAEGGFRELTVHLSSATDFAEFTVRRRADEASVQDGMILFAAEPEYVFPTLGELVQFSAKPAPIAAYWLDATEVSNADYARFVEETGHRVPRLWESVPDRAAFLRDHGDLPVSGLTWTDAIDFATWAGKRLPTVAEWIRAAVGDGGREYPWGPRVQGEELRGNTRRAAAPAGTPPWQAYVLSAAPVRSFPDARSPEGIYHLYGNVKEWTESTVIVEEFGRSTRRSGDRIVLGGGWNVFYGNYQIPVCSIGWTSAGEDTRASNTGFRCARSAAP